MGQEYSLNITESLTSPWESGSLAISNYQDTFGKAISATTAQLDELAKKYNALTGDLATTVESEGSKHVNEVNKNVSEYSKAVEEQKPSSNGTNSTTKTPAAQTPSTAGMVSSISGTIYYGQTGDRVKKLQQALNALGFNCGSVDGKFGPQTLAAVKAFQKAMGLDVDGRVGPATKAKFKLKGYAVGTTGVNADQWALIDELGDELTIHAKNGRVAYLEKGSSVIPADLTENLMAWGALDPSNMLDQNRPAIGAPHVVNSETVISIEYGDILHIDNFDGNNPDELAKMIDKAFDKHMKDLNQQIKRYTR